MNTARDLQKLAEGEVGPVPFIPLLNKSDLVEEWEIEDGDTEAFSAGGWTLIQSSAKTGEGVEAAFMALTRKMLGE